MESLLERSNFSSRRLQTTLIPIDARPCLHGQLHVGPQVGQPLLAVFLLEEISQQVALLIHRLSQHSATWTALSGRECGGGLSSARSKDEQLGEGVGTEAVRPIDADASRFAGGVESG